MINIQQEIYMQSDIGNNKSYALIAWITFGYGTNCTLRTVGKAWN